MKLGTSTGIGAKNERERTQHAPCSSSTKRRPAHAKHLRRVHKRRLRLRDVRDAVHAHAHGREQAVPVEDAEEHGARVRGGLDDAHGVPEGHVGRAVPAAFGVRVNGCMWGERFGGQCDQWCEVRLEKRGRRTRTHLSTAASCSSGSAAPMTSLATSAISLSGSSMVIDSSECVDVRCARVGCVSEFQSGWEVRVGRVLLRVVVVAVGEDGEDGERDGLREAE